MKSLASFGKTFVCGSVALTAALLAGCQAPNYAFHDAAGKGTNAPPVKKTPVSVPPVADSGGLTNRNYSIDFLRPGYKVTITFSGVPNPPPKHEEKVREDGHLSPPLLNHPVLASGKTI